jgi:ligand-binding SRPBCC domain-containing protein
MPRFERTLRLSRPAAEVFDFFADPANMVRVSPPELHMSLEEGPKRLALGSRIAIKVRRWGIPQRVVSEVTVFEPGVRFVDEQRQGPFGKWVHEHRFEAAPEGCVLHDVIDFEPPGGLMGLLVTANWVQKDLEWVFSCRDKKLRELLEST